MVILREKPVTNLFFRNATTFFAERKERKRLAKNRAKQNQGTAMKEPGDSGVTVLYRATSVRPAVTQKNDQIH